MPTDKPCLRARKERMKKKLTARQRLLPEEAQYDHKTSPVRADRIICGIIFTWKVGEYIPKPQEEPQLEKIFCNVFNQFGKVSMDGSLHRGESFCGPCVVIGISPARGSNQENLRALSPMRRKSVSHCRSPLASFKGEVWHLTFDPPSHFKIFDRVEFEKGRFFFRALRDSWNDVSTNPVPLTFRRRRSIPSFWRSL